MLVISRKPEESIEIGDHVRIRILKVEGHRVRLGIEAPREQTIIRSELRAKLSQDTPAVA
jgi:carbon storage regulator